MTSGEWVNRQTGEIADTLHVLRGRRYPKGVEFMTMFRDGWEYLAQLRLTPRESAVLFKLLARLDYDNWIAVSQQTLGEELKISKGNVSEAVAALVKHGILEVDRDPADKRRAIYRLSASLGWKGDAKDWAQAIQKRTKGNVIPLPGVVLPKMPRTEHEEMEAAGQIPLF